MSELQNRIVGVVGRKGSGKSTGLREIVSCRERVVIFDTMGEHRSPNPFSRLESCLAFLEKRASAPRFHCALRGGDEKTLDEVCRACYEVGGLVLAVEEVPWFSNASYQPEGLTRITQMGRHRKIDLVWTAQRMAEVSRRLTSATDVFVLFAMTEPRDLDALAERCGPEVAGKVQGLGLHGRLVYDVLKAKTCPV